MSIDSNKSLIKKAQSELKALGYDIKSGHLYEVFSKLSGESSWNIASAKSVDLSKALNSGFTNIPEKNHTNPELQVTINLEAEDQGFDGSYFWFEVKGFSQKFIDSEIKQKTFSNALELRILNHQKEPLDVINEDIFEHGKTLVEMGYIEEYMPLRGKKFFNMKKKPTEDISVTVFVKMSSMEQEGLDYFTNFIKGEISKANKEGVFSQK